MDKQHFFVDYHTSNFNQCIQISSELGFPEKHIPWGERENKRILNPRCGIKEEIQLYISITTKTNIKQLTIYTEKLKICRERMRHQEKKPHLPGINPRWIHVKNAR